jgi:hypothetical protein
METIDLEAQESRVIRRTSSRLSISSLDPWKLWTNLHNELSRLAAIRTTRLEDESSHVTLAKQKNIASSAAIASVYNQDDFDFALVLSPNEAYAFWARYLDFRDEALCYAYEQDVVVDDSTIATKEEGNVSQNQDGELLYTPKNSSGLRRRRTAASNTDENNLQSSKGTPQHTPLFSSINSTLSPLPRPSMMKSSQKRTTLHQKSLFERAVDKFSPRFSIGGSPKPSSRHMTPMRDTPENNRDVYSTTGKLRRRWGNQDYDGHNVLSSTPNLTSPPIVSLKSRRLGSARKPWKGVSSSGKRASRKARSLFESAEKLGKRGRETMLEGVVSVDETDEDNFFASPGIPRGVGEYYVFSYDFVY